LHDYLAAYDQVTDAGQISLHEQIAVHTKDCIAKGQITLNRHASVGVNKPGNCYGRLLTLPKERMRSLNRPFFSGLNLRYVFDGFVLESAVQRRAAVREPNR
jgi:hypothetical protein